MKTIIKVIFSLNLLLLIAACNSQGKKDSSSEQEMNLSDESAETEEPNVVLIKTADYVFLEVPDTVPSGMTAFRVENEGNFPHNAGVVRLTADHTYEELIEYVMNNSGQFPDWIVHVGGPSAPLSGEASEATLPLFPGNYVLICGVPVPAGVPHFMKGMTRPLTVVGDGKAKALSPERDLKMTLDDYSFTMTPEITAGTKTIEVENIADQPHEFILARLREGKSAEDMLNWLGTVIQSDAPVLPEAPGEFLNGVSPLDKGLVNYVNVDFSPGEYLLICPMLDKEDGRPHFMHGMVHQFTVDEK